MQNYLVATSRPAEFLRAACQLYASPTSTLTCKGDLSQVRVDQVPVVSRIGTSLTVRLAVDDVEQVFQNVVACGGVTSRISHWLVHRDGRLVCAAFDCFADGSVWIEATREFLDDLLDRGTIRWFGPNPHPLAAPERGR